MAQTLVIYPFTDITIGHTKSESGATAASLINEPVDSATGYIGHVLDSSTSTKTSTFGGLDTASDVVIGKVRINTIDSVNLYGTIYRSNTDATIRNINIFGSVTINGNTYQSESYTENTDVTESSQVLQITGASINRIYPSLADAGIEMLLSTAGSYSSNKERTVYIRIYNANVTINYDNVFDAKAEVIPGKGIASATPSLQEVVEGENCTFTATVQSGYEFSGWYDNENFVGNPVSTALAFTTAITGNTTLYPFAVEPNIKLHMKDGTAWRRINTVFKKSGGEWLQQHDLLNVFDENMPYVKG